MRPSRRQVLRATLALPLSAGLGAGLAGCTDAPPRPPVPVNPDDALRTAAVDRETDLLRAYDAAVLLRPDLAALLQPLRAEHAEHLLALTGPATLPPVSPAATPLAPAPNSTAPSSPAPLLTELIKAERQAGAGHAADALVASRPLASLLAALSASEFSHPVALA